MLKRLILCYKINKFYRIFGEIVGYKPARIRMRDISDDFLMSIGFDINEALEGACNCRDKMSVWLNKLYKEVI